MLRKDDMMKPALVAIGFVGLLAPPLAAQSPLADAAKKAEEQRKTSDAGKPTGDTKDAKPLATKAYTNKDLTSAPAPAIRETASSTDSAPTSASADESARADEYRKTAKKDEAYWKARMRELQIAADASRIHLTAMERRAASLSADFKSSDVVSDRLALRRELEYTQTEVTRLKAAALIDKNAISTLEEEARRASVPPGWLRP
jgi:type IV secretory pathway VirB10-like protein